MSLAAPAGAVEVELRCPRLTPAELDELNARVRLRLGVVSGSHPPLRVGCTQAAAWVEWKGRRFEVEGRVALVDELIELIEHALEPEPAETAPEPVQAGPTPAELPPVDDARAKGTNARPTRAANWGGVALGLESELSSQQIGAALGPAFEEGANVGPVTLGARQAFRFSLTEPQVSFMDVEGLVGLGAPFQFAAPFGVSARFGVELMAAHPQGVRLLAAAPLAGIGVRAARYFHGFGLWIGLDGRWRMTTLRVGEPDASVTASALSASFSLGVSFLDTPRDPKGK